MHLSFVIPAHNEEALTGRSIGCIQRAMDEFNRSRAAHTPQVAPPLSYEIIVAADGCTDRTVEIARAAQAAVYEHDRRQIAATRNLGARHATGDVLFFIDADTYVRAENLAQALDALDAGAVGGGAPFRLDGEISWHVRCFLAMLMLLFRLAKYTGGAFLFCRRDAFAATGGWDEQFYASEEIHLANALKKQGRFVIIRDVVHTSGRKARAYSGLRVWGFMFKTIFRPSTLKQREHMWMWYDPRKPDATDNAPMP